METATGFTRSNLRCEGYVVALLKGHITDDPFSYDELIGCVDNVNGEEFDLVLLVDKSVQAEVTHLRVTVFNLTAGTRNSVHTFYAESICLCERIAFVIVALVRCGESIGLGHNHIVFQLAHCFKLKACSLCKGSSCFLERLLRTTCQRIAFSIEESAKQSERRNLSKRIHESRRETRQYIKVRAGSLNRLEQTGTVNTLTASEDRVKVVHIRNHEVQRLQTSIAGRIKEVDHTNAVFADVANDVGFRKFRCRLTQITYNVIRVVFE